MTEAPPFRAPPCARIAAISALALLAGGCTFDFDAPFAVSGEGGGDTSSGPTSPSSSTTTAGEGGQGQGAGPTVTVSSSSSATTTTATSQSSGQPLEEDCGNRVDDDDDDDDVDCEDSTCQASGYTCSPAAPEGFFGPVALVRGSPTVQPSCGGSFPEELIAGGIGDLSAEAGTCTDCSCAAPVGVTCSATLSWYSDGMCSLQAGSSAVVDSGCVNVADVTGASLHAGAPVAVGGSCLAAGGVATLPGATFEETVKLCGAPQGAGCGDGVCLGAPEPQFDQKLCVYKIGDGTCAGAEPFTTLVEISQDVDDQRGCSMCNCAGPTEVSCTGSTEVFTNNQNCTGQSAVLPHDGSCDGGNDIRSIDTNLVSSGGSCTASGGAPSGTAFAIDPVTVCCLF